MRESITSFGIANTVRMAHTQREVTFLLVEGVSDVACFSSFIHQDRCELLPCFGKATAVGAIQSLNSTNEPGVLAVVDADFDRVCGEVEQLSNCIFTEFHDLEMVILYSESLDKVLRERGSSNKLVAAEEEWGVSVREFVVRAATPIGELRFLNQRDCLGVKFDSIPFKKIVDADSLAVKLAKLCEFADRLNAQGLTAAEIGSRMAALELTGVSPWQLCCGHDVVSILAIGLRGKIGSQKASEVDPESIERELRLSFGWEHFQQSALYPAIRLWEQSNYGWTVLRANPMAARTPVLRQTD